MASYDLTISIIISAYNEQEVLEDFWKELQNVLQGFRHVEVIFVNDGSTDRSRELLNGFALQNEVVKIIHFSKNFGHEAAMIAGIDHASGDAIICMDCDLQHPPGFIPTMIEKWSNGYDIIKMRRIERADTGWARSLISDCFYHLINRISQDNIEPNVSDFFLITQKVADTLRADYRERTRFLRGIVQNMGFKQTSVDFIAPSRKKGRSKYSLFTLFVFSISALATSSKLPLHLGIYASIVCGIAGFIVTIYTLVMNFLAKPVSGYTTIVVLISFLFSVHFFFMGVLAEYIGFIFDEVKHRPLYIIDEKIHF